MKHEVSHVARFKTMVKFLQMNGPSHKSLFFILKLYTTCRALKVISPRINWFIVFETKRYRGSCWFPYLEEWARDFPKQDSADEVCFCENEAHLKWCLLLDCRVLQKDYNDIKFLLCQLRRECVLYTGRLTSVKHEQGSITVVGNM